MDVERIAAQVVAATEDWEEEITVAVMGCVVNGPGEASQADIGIAGGKTGSVLFRKGCAPEKIEGDPMQTLMEALRQYRATK